MSTNDQSGEAIVMGPEKATRDGCDPAKKSVTISNKLEERSYKDPLRELHPSSAVIRAGYNSDLSERAIKPPVFRSSTFEFASAQEGELFFQRAYRLPGNDSKSPGLVYSRLNNPNTEIFEDKILGRSSIRS